MCPARSGPLPPLSLLSTPREARSPGASPVPQAPMPRPVGRLRSSAPSRQPAAWGRQTWPYQAPQTARSADRDCLQRSEQIGRQRTSVAPVVQHKKLVDPTRRRSAAIKVIGLSALFGVINAPLLMPNPPAAVVAAPGTNLAAAALANSMRDNKRQSSSYLQALIALRCPLCRGRIAR
jgi:hypothetical protein